jgi:hypothetical protein
MIEDTDRSLAMRGPHIDQLERDLIAAAERIANDPASRPTLRWLSGLRARKRSIAIAVGAAAIAAVVAFIVGAGSDPHASATDPPTGDVLTDHFAIFRQAPAKVTDAENPFTPSGKLLGVNVADARRVTVADRDVWLARGTSKVCLMTLGTVGSGASAGTCVRATQVLADGAFVWGHPAPADVASQRLPADTAEVAGLVPDGVASVTFTLADGSVKQVPVTSNVVAATFDASPRSARFRDADDVAHNVRL